MITLVQLQTIAKPARAKKLLNYLQHKQTGGANNARGNQFENLYTIYKIATLWNENSQLTFFSAQEFCFVDDLVIHSKNQEIEHYQIKDVKKITWNAGKNTLEDDFKNQKNLYKKTESKIRLFMIVSDKNLSRRLQKDMSFEMKKAVKVAHFPAASSPNRLLIECPAFREAIVDLCALTNPGTDALELIAAQLLGQWDFSSKKKVTLGHIKNNCLTSSPQYFKGGGNHISQQLDTLLKSIIGLTFTISNGTIEWTYDDFNGISKGALSFKIGTTAFAQFENDILNFPAGVTFANIEHLFV